MKKKSINTSISKKTSEEELFQKNKELIQLKELMYLSNSLSKTGAWEVNLDTNIIFWDRSSKEIMEVPLDFSPTVEEVRSFYKEGEGRDAIIKAVTIAKKDGISYDITCIVISAKNKELIIRTIGKPVMKNGKCVRFYGSFQDVTAQKHQEERINQQNIKLATQNNELSISNRIIKEGEKTFKNLFNNSTDFIYIQNLDGTFIDVNKNVIETYGYSKKYIIGKTPKIFDSPGLNDLTALQKNIKKAADGKTVHFEWWAKKKNGEVFLKETTLRKGSYFGENVLITVARDITEKEKTANLLKESEKKYKSIFNSLLDVYYEADMDGVIEIVSPSMKNLLGFTSEEIIGKKAGDYYKNPKDKDLLIVNLKKTGVLNNYPVTLVGKGEKDIHIEASIVLKYNKDKKPYKYVAMLRDVTEKKEAEKQLIDSEKKYKSIFNSLTDVYFEYDTYGKITIISPSVKNVLGYTSEEMVGTEVVQYHKTPSKRKKLIKRVEEFGKAENYQLALLSKENKVVYVEASLAFKLNKKGERIKSVGMLRDITQRKNDQKLLAQSEEKYRLIFNSLLDVYYEADLEGAIKIVSPSIKNLLGYTPKEIIGENAASFYTILSDRDLLIKNLQEKGVLHNYKVTVLSKENRKVHLEVDVELKRNIKGEYYKYIAMLRDVTEKREAEKLLIDSEKKYRSLNNSASDGIIISNQQGIITSWNIGAEKIFQYSEKEILGKPILTIIPKEFAGKHLKGIEKQLLTKKLTNKGKVLNLSGLRKDGEVFPIEISLSSWVSENESNFSAIIRDVSVRKKAREQINKLSIALEQSVNTVIITDVNGVIEYANQRITVKTGYNLNEIIGKNIGITLSKNHTKKFYEAIWSIVLSGKSWNGIVQSRKKDNSSFWENVTITPIKNDKGKIINFLSVKEDITERKESEKLLETERKHVLKAQYEGEENEKNRIATELHDGLGQILTAAKFSLKAIENQKTLDLITKGKIRTVKHLINDADIETRRISRSLLPRILEDFGLEKAVEKMLNDIQNAFNIRAFLTISPQTKIVKETEKIVYRIIQESINNAVKHSKLSVLEVFFDATNKYNIFTISDNGKGFDTKLKSTGLGLDNLKQRALSIDAHLKIISDKKKGTTIILKIKRKSE